MFFFADIPYTVIEKSSYTAFIGLSIELKCIVQSIPTHTYVYWTHTRNHTSTVIIPGTVGFEVSTTDNPSLDIPSVNLFMSGDYRCIAINEIGTGISLPATLTGKPYREVQLMFNRVICLFFNIICCLYTTCNVVVLIFRKFICMVRSFIMNKSSYTHWKRYVSNICAIYPFLDRYKKNISPHLWNYYSQKLIEIKLWGQLY